jgi:CBS domain-containing protein
MTPGPDTVAPDDTVRFAAQRMVEGGHRRLVVIDDGAVVGVVSRSDLLRRYGRPDTEIANDVRRLLADPFRVPEDHAIQPTIDAGVVVLDGTVRRHTDIEIAEAEVAALPGVVAVDNHLHAREHRPIAPPLRRW